MRLFRASWACCVCSNKMILDPYHTGAKVLRMLITRIKVPARHFKVCRKYPCSARKEKMY
jgi:hypothetical protein